MKAFAATTPIRRHVAPALALALALALAILPAGLPGLTSLGVADEPAATAAPDPEAVKNLAAAYPPAAAGKTRHVILLPHKERGEEDDFKVEIVAGRTIDTDGVNQVRFGGEFREKDIPGWGYSFFEVDALAGPLSTRVAPAPGTPTEKRFVPGPRMLVRYNSRLPLVVYTPEGTEVRYRLWRAADDLAPAEAR